MKPARYLELQELARETLHRCAPLGYPISYKKLAARCGIPLYTYQSLSASERVLHQIQMSQWKPATFPLHAADVESAEQTAVEPASIIVNNGSRAVYYDGTLEDPAPFIMHEIAHWLLKHEENTPENELEANYLAAYLTAPPDSGWGEIPKKRKVFQIAVCTVAMIAIFCLGCLFNRLVLSQSAPQTANNIIDSSSATQFTGTVYVTRTGEKYHKIGCRYLQNKDGLTEYNVSEAQKQGYGACQICFGEYE